MNNTGSFLQEHGLFGRMNTNESIDVVLRLTRDLSQL